MKLIATRQATVNEIGPDEGVTHEGKRYIVDEVHRNRDGWSLSCNSEENPSVSRRKTISFKDGETVTIEAGEVDRRKILDTIARLMAGEAPDSARSFDYDSKDGTLSLAVGDDVVAWTILLEA